MANDKTANNSEKETPENGAKFDAGEILNALIADEAAMQLLVEKVAASAPPAPAHVDIAFALVEDPEAAQLLVDRLSAKLADSAVEAIAAKVGDEVKPAIEALARESFAAILADPKTADAAIAAAGEALTRDAATKAAAAAEGQAKAERTEAQKRADEKKRTQARRRKLQELREEVDEDGVTLAEAKAIAWPAGEGASGATIYLSDGITFLDGHARMLGVDDTRSTTDGLEVVVDFFPPVDGQGGVASEAFLVGQDQDGKLVAVRRDIGGLPVGDGRKAKIPAGSLRF